MYPRAAGTARVDENRAAVGSASVRSFEDCDCDCSGMVWRGVGVVKRDGEASTFVAVEAGVEFNVFGRGDLSSLVNSLSL